MSASEIRDFSMLASDGRTVGWTECGPADGRPVVRLPGAPGGRWSVPGDRTPWAERDLRVITTERPGFGVSTRLRGRGCTEPARDVLEILDRLELDRVCLYGAGSGAPHLLAFAATWPDRVRAASVSTGIAPMTDDDAATMGPLDVRARRLARQGDLAGLEALLAPVRARLMADPLAEYHAVMSKASQPDQLVMVDPRWQLATSRATRDALGGGVDGWIDDLVAVFGDDHADAGTITTSITWWHQAADRTAPLGAAQRLVAALPAGTMRALPDDGHFSAYRREAEILDELLARA